MKNLSGADPSNWNNPTEEKQSNESKKTTPKQSKRKSSINVNKELESLEKIYEKLTKKYDEYPDKELGDVIVMLSSSIRSLQVIKFDNAAKKLITKN